MFFIYTFKHTEGIDPCLPEKVKANGMSILMYDTGLGTIRSERQDIQQGEVEFLLGGKITNFNLVSKYQQ